MIIGWEMTLKDFRERFQNKEFLDRILILRDNAEKTVKKYNFDFAISCLLGGTKKKEQSAKIYDSCIKNGTWPSNCGHAFRSSENGETLRNIPDTLNTFLAGIDENQSLQFVCSLFENGRIEAEAKPYSIKDSKLVIDALKIISGGEIDVERIHNSMEKSIRSTSNKVDEKINSLIRNSVKQIILTGAPGTGKTYMAREIALKTVLGEELYEKYKSLNEENEEEKKLKGWVDRYISGEDAGEMGKLIDFFGMKEINLYKGRIGFVQFHPSYDYTDFVEGLRPVKDRNSNEIGFALKDGIFKNFCDYASNGRGKYFFIIDEINRADLSKVFGELMFGLEESYRGKPFKTQYSSLRKEMNEDGKYVDFTIPENLYIIGTMNDIDRSVETFDFALRRRFVWIELEANEMIRGCTGNTNDFNREKSSLYSMLKNELIESDIKELAESAVKLNNVISDSGKDFNLNRHYHLGPAYFGKIDNEKEFDIAKRKLWEIRIEPILREYIRGYEENKISTFINECRLAFGLPAVQYDGDVV